MDIDRCIAAYSDLAEAVFRKKGGSLPFNINCKAKACFDSAKLEKAVKEVVAESGTSEEALLNDGNGHKYRT